MHLDLDSKTFLLDIEGTTTPISFVFDVLFPYAREHLAEFLAATWNDDATQRDVSALRAQHAEDVSTGGAPETIASLDVDGVTQRDAVVAYCLALMDADRKVTPLKSLQGRIWRAGYEGGRLRGVVFDDVPGALSRWHDAGRRCCIYSSGSVEAQKLLFANSTHGDLTPHIAAYFDTTTGHKRAPASYRAIAQASGLQPSQMFFLTDVVAEADAAREAGMGAAIMDRPGNRPQPEHAFPILRDFSAL